MNRHALGDADSADLPADDVLPVHSQWIGDLCRRGQREFGLFLLALGEQFGDSDAQSLGQEKGFLVSNASDACLNFREGSPGDVQSDPLAFGGELFLR